MITFDDRYLKYFMKRPGRLMFPFKLTHEKRIEEAVEKSKERSLLAKNVRCVFNSDSLMNVVRREESKRAYLDESQKETKTYAEFERTVMRHYASMFKSSKFISDNLDKSIGFDKECPDESGKTFGIVCIEAVVDMKIMNESKFVKDMSRVACSCGYNYVDYTVTLKDAKVNHQGEVVACSKVFIQFEASYIDGTQLMPNDYVYHVTTKNVVDKMFRTRTGLIPSNRNSMGMEYPPRVYCFVDNDQMLQKTYASGSGKKNRKFIECHKLDELKRSYVELCRKTSGTLVDTQEFAVLKIDLSQIEHVKFYRDNMFEMDGEFKAIFTEQCIPFEAISKAGELCLDDEC